MVEESYDRTREQYDKESLDSPVPEPVEAEKEDDDNSADDEPNETPAPSEVVRGTETVSFD